MEKQRIFMEICYDGTAYSGWQIQPNAPTVQGTIESALTKLNGNKPVGIVGCGRTDTGVHAKQYFFHVELPDVSLAELQYKLNKMLPSDIKIIDAFYNEQHARFDQKNAPIVILSPKKSHRSTTDFVGYTNGLYP